MKFGINRVKIRILSGGKEHSTLESLRKSFSLEDVLPSYNDGRLATWLRQRDEDDIADKLVKLKQEEKQPEALALALINIFFNGEKGEEFNSVLDFANYCMQNGQKLTADCAYDYVIQQNGEDELIELAIKGILTIEKALKNGISGKTMYIICRNLLNDAGENETKKDDACQWFYEAEKCDIAETVDFRETEDYKKICDIISQKVEAKVFKFGSRKFIDFGLSVCWSKEQLDSISTLYATDIDQYFSDSYNYYGLQNNFRVPSTKDAEDLIKIYNKSHILEANGIRIGDIRDKNNGLFLPFIESKNYGYIWLSGSNIFLFYDKNGKIELNNFNRLNSAFLFVVLDKVNKSNINIQNTYGNKIISEHEAVDIGLSVFWSAESYIKNPVKQPQQINWRNNVWRYPNHSDIIELMNCEDKSVTKLGITINKKLFLPFFRDKDYGYIWAENDGKYYQLYYNRKKNMELPNGNSDEGAYIFPVIPKNRNL